MIAPDGVFRSYHDVVGRLWGAARDRSQVAVNLNDAASRRTRITWPEAFYAVYDYDVVGAITAIRENGATSGAGVLAASRDE
ncbi:MAG: hypothetical protein HXY28_04550 [Hydrogenophilaceae bacterium]|jgi:hypothetical protein|nr:hypothetical protein [Hydrogenophilaceae bacterium]